MQVNRRIVFAFEFPYEFVCLYFELVNILWTIVAEKSVSNYAFGGRCKICFFYFRSPASHWILFYIKWPMACHAGFFASLTKEKYLSKNESWPKEFGMHADNNTLWMSESRICPILNTNGILIHQWVFCNKLCECITCTYIIK